jgi:CelD/BcsL family acetyltransferase involved in cellulose biosynthesis
MHLDHIEDFADFLALEADWTELCRRARRESFFLSHAWFRCCWLGRAGVERPFVVVVRDGSEIVGLAPFFVSMSKWRIFPVRTASLMHNQDSPFVDAVLAPERAGETLRAILDHVRRFSKAHVVSFNKIPSWSPTHALLANCGAQGSLIRTPGGRSPILRLEGDWSGFWTAQSQRFKKTVRNVANRVERLGQVAVEELSTTASAEECMEVFASVAERSWKAELPISPRRNPSVRRFFEALTSALHARGRLLLWTLRLDGLPIATEYHVRDGDAVYALRSDFDEHHREASPGAHLNAHIIRTYFERGVRIYDMGPGDRDYKQRWANGACPRETFSLFSRTPYALALYNVECRAVPALRRVREWWYNRGRGWFAGARVGATRETADG